jgi:hypothetical protein
MRKSAICCSSIATKNPASMRFACRSTSK